jgi:GUN4-like
MTTKSSKKLMLIAATILTFIIAWHHQSRQVNYSKLEMLLKNERWIEADQETGKLMNQILILAVDSKKFWGYSRIDLFGQERVRVLGGAFNSCQDFRRIDVLWAEYSGRKYGFSAQAKVLSKLKPSFSKSVATSYKDEFYREVGWQYNWRFRDSDWFSQAGEVSQKTGFLPSPYWFITNSPKPMNVVVFVDAFRSCL